MAYARRIGLGFSGDISVDDVPIARGFVVPLRGARRGQDRQNNPASAVFPDYIVCLEDGMKFKSLKRHLRTHHEMSPEEYRERWGLAHDYPMVAPNYAAARSALAKKLGLGQKGGRRKSKS